jgi:hypothetical protein
MPQGGCPEHARLAQEVDSLLRKMIDLTKASHEAFVRGKEAEFMRLDQETENTVGAKERAIGALNQHIGEHGCSSLTPPYPLGHVI